MRFILLVTCALAVFASTSCGGASTPSSPSVVGPAAGLDRGSQPGGAATTTTGTAAAAVALSGVVRGLDARNATFSLVTRAGTRTILTDSQTQVWNKTTQVRLPTLRDGQSVSIRGYDHARYVLARTIAID
jgi:hypothetical protein